MHGDDDRSDDGARRAAAALLPHQSAIQVLDGASLHAELLVDADDRGLETLLGEPREDGTLPAMVATRSAVPIPASIVSSWYRPISVGEYHQMIDAKVFTEDDRLELLDGVVVRMSPQTSAHAHVIAYLNELLVRALPPRLQLRCQLPLTLSRSEPEPDFAVVERRAAYRAPRHPTTAILVIEVAVDSLDKDRIKAATYAEAGVAEYWIVDVVHRCVEVQRAPQRSRRAYTERAVVRRGTLASTALPEIAVPLAPLFPAHRRP